MDDRKASDILVNIEQIVKNLERKFALQEFQNSLIIEQQNRLLNLLQDDTPEPYPIINNPAQKKSINIDPIKTDDDFVFRVNNKPVEIPIDKPLKEITEKVLQGKLIPITQRLVDPNGDPIENLEIRVLDDRNDLVKISKSNSSGRWNTALPSGRYTAKISGKYKNNKIDTAQTFIIPTSFSSILELPSPLFTIPK